MLFYAKGFLVKTADLNDFLSVGHHWIFTPMIGETFVRSEWNYNIEIRVSAPNIANNTSTVDYKTPFGTHGAFGIYVGCTRKF